MIKINLVPKEILDKAKQRQQMLQASAAGALAVAFLVILSAAHFFALRRLQSRLDVANKKLKMLQSIVAKVEEMEKDESYIRTRLQVVDSLLKNRPLYPYFMSDLARSVPSGVQVKSLQTKGGGDAGASLKISITASSVSNEDIAAWIRNMEGSGRFDSVELGAVNAQGGQNQGQNYGFSVNSVYTPAL